MRAHRLAHLSGIAALVASLLVATPAPAAEPQASLPDIEDEVMCPICGTTLELSDSPQAERERELIRGLIVEGRSKDEIKDALVAEYGDEVLASPEKSGFDLSAWVVPALGIALGATAVGLAMVRMSKRDPPSGGDAIDAADAARLEKDMSSSES